MKNIDFFHLQKYPMLFCNSLKTSLQITTKNNRKTLFAYCQLARVDVVVLVDCTEAFCNATLRRRSERPRTGREDDLAPTALKARLASFKQHTLPMLKFFDERHKLRVVSHRQIFTTKTFICCFTPI